MKLRYERGALADLNELLAYISADNSPAIPAKARALQKPVIPGEPRSGETRNPVPTAGDYWIPALGRFAPSAGMTAVEHFRKALAKAGIQS